MTTPKAQAFFLKWLDEQIEQAKEDAKETKDSPNSYGHGFDSGFRDGLMKVKEYFTGDND